MFLQVGKKGAMICQATGIPRTEIEVSKAIKISQRTYYSLCLQKSVFLLCSSVY